MITESFRKAVSLKEGGIVIVAGSDSDKKHIGELVKNLEKYCLPYEVRIASAHKQPSEVFLLVREYDALHAPLVYITVAGGTDALSGMVAQHSLRPVISCPPDSPNESCLRNPLGSSNAYITTPANAARFVAQMFSLVHGGCEWVLEEELQAKVTALREADKNSQDIYAKKQVKR